MYVHGFRFYFTPLQGFFSPFPHGTGSLSVGREYLALEGGPPIFSQNFTCSDLLDFTLKRVSHTGLSPCIVRLSRLFYYSYKCLRAGPRSLAATRGISVDFFSSGYLDVSVLRVSLPQGDIHKGWVFPFGNPRIKACLLAPRGLSQVTTSFVAFYRLGIHRVRLVT